MGEVMIDRSGSCRSWLATYANRCSSSLDRCRSSMYDASARSLSRNLVMSRALKTTFSLGRVRSIGDGLHQGCRGQLHSSSATASRPPRPHHVRICAYFSRPTSWYVAVVEIEHPCVLPYRARRGDTRSSGRASRWPG